MSERTSGICTRTSVQVAIGLFPIDSVRGKFLSSSSLPFCLPLKLFFRTCSLHLPFTCLHLPIRYFFPLFFPLFFSLIPRHSVPFFTSNRVRWIACLLVEIMSETMRFSNIGESGYAARIFDRSSVNRRNASRVERRTRLIRWRQ